MKKKLIKLTENGVTLIEILIVMGLLSVLLIVIATIFTSAADVQQQSSTYNATNENGRFIMARLNYDIQRAFSVVTPNSLGATSSSLNLDIGGINYIYGLSSGNLTLEDNNGQDNLNGNDVTVSNLSFQELGNNIEKPIISYSFTLSSITTNHGKSDTKTFTSAESIQP
jgi:prepilin-type N-terminal cleavage/methylation domain-containing protein